MTYYTVIYQDRGSSDRPAWWFFYITTCPGNRKALAAADDLARRNSHRPFVTEVFRGNGRDARIECDRRNRRTR